MLRVMPRCALVVIVVGCEALLWWGCYVLNCGFGQAMQQLLEETGADGYNGDTMVPFSPNQHPSRTSA